MAARRKCHATVARLAQLNGARAVDGPFRHELRARRAERMATARGRSCMAASQARARRAGGRRTKRRAAYACRLEVSIGIRGPKSACPLSLARCGECLPCEAGARRGTSRGVARMLERCALRSPLWCAQRGRVKSCHGRPRVSVEPGAVWRVRTASARRATQGGEGKRSSCGPTRQSARIPSRQTARAERAAKGQPQASCAHLGVRGTTPAVHLNEEGAELVRVDLDLCVRSGARSVLSLIHI